MTQVTLYRAAVDSSDVHGCWTPDRDYARCYLDADAGGDRDYWGQGEVLLSLTVPVEGAEFLPDVGNDDQADWQLRILPRVPEGTAWIVYEDDALSIGWDVVDADGNAFYNDAPYTWVFVGERFPIDDVEVSAE